MVSGNSRRIVSHDFFGYESLRISLLLIALRLHNVTLSNACWRDLYSKYLYSREIQTKLFLLLRERRGREREREREHRDSTIQP